MADYSGDDTSTYKMISQRPAETARKRPKTARRDMLEKAANTVDGDRDAEYGGPEDSFAKIAAIWSAMKGVSFTPTDVAMMLAGMKLARLESTKGSHVDSWLDLAGYAACGYEVSRISKGSAEISSTIAS